jgi:chemotaxis signal transduction protein
MSDAHADMRPEGTAETLRRQFDRSFADARRLETEQFETLLAVRIRGDAFVLRLSEIGGLFADRNVTPVPGPVPELLGIAGFRGAIVPVYDVGALLGYPAAADCRWLVLSAGHPPIGLAFDQLEGVVRVGSLDLAPADGAHARHQHVRELARTSDGARALVHVPSIVETITKLAHHRT